MAASLCGLLFRCLREVSHDVRHVMPSRAVTAHCDGRDKINVMSIKL
jgi:hypothetical protein